MMLEQKHLHAFAVTASSYSSGEHYTFYDAGTPIEPWQRSQRIAIQGRLTHEHLLASSAIPFVFPATCLHVDGHPGWFGDGSMRQTAPLSPAVHLGAQRLLIIGAGRMQEPAGERTLVAAGGYPNLAQIAGHAMSSIFLDALAVDIERMRRINRTLALLPNTWWPTPAAAAGSAGDLAEPRLDDIAARQSVPCRRQCVHCSEASVSTGPEFRQYPARQQRRGARFGAGQLPVVEARSRRS